MSWNSFWSSVKDEGVRFINSFFKNPEEKVIETPEEKVPESSDIGFSQDIFDSSKESIAEAQKLAEEYAEQANVANREFYDYSFSKSEVAAENAYKRQVRWLEDYYPSLLKSIRDAGLNPNLVLSGGASVSAPSASVASGDTLRMNKSELVYDNIYMQLLKQQMTDSNRIFTTSLQVLSNVLGKLIPKL